MADIATQSEEERNGYKVRQYDLVLDTLLLRTMRRRLGRQAMASDESGPAALSARFRTLVLYLRRCCCQDISLVPNTTVSSCALFRKVPLRS